MRSKKLGAVGVLAACVISTTALANRQGVAGQSGKQAGQWCVNCHGAAAPTPTVTLEGPTTLEAGATGQYTLIVSGGPGVKAGTNVATSAGTLQPVTGSGLKGVGGELTHQVPKDFASGEARFDFSVVAPTTRSSFTLFGAGNSVNGDNASTGDSAAITTLAVTVNGATEPPDAGTGNPPGNEDTGGCSAVGGPPMALLLVGLGALLSRRRRS